MLYNNDRWEVSEVWYDYAEHSWVVTGFDWNGDLIDGSDYSHLKVDALDTAMLYMKNGRCDKVRVFTQDGRLLRTVER
jgi:hypothetical protein